MTGKSIYFILFVSLINITCKTNKSNYSNNAVFKFENLDRIILEKKLTRKEANKLIDENTDSKCRVENYYIFLLSDSSIYYNDKELVNTCNHIFNYLFKNRNFFVNKSIFMRLQLIPTQNVYNKVIEEFKMISVNGQARFILTKDSKELKFINVSCRHSKF